MLELANLEKRFGDFTAVNKINLKIAVGQLYGFLGPNGAGKTTTIKMITGLLAPTSGNIILDGENILHRPLESKMKIGYIPDQPYLYDKLTGREYLYFSGGLFNITKEKLTKEIDELIRQLKIGDWIDKRTEEYSQGMKQRIVIAVGQLYGFLGPNGAGKTTTIKMITGLLAPTSGNIFLGGENILHRPLESKMKIGYIPDQPYLYDKLTGREYLYFSGGLFNITKEKLTKEIDELTRQLKIGDWIDKRTEEYSQGMKQRIVIASAFLHSPKLLIIDEPMIGLDPQSAFVVKKLLKDKVSDGITIFMSTHSLNVVEEICTHVGIINNGNIIFDGTIETLLRMKQEHNRNLEKIFIELTEENESDYSHT